MSKWTHIAGTIRIDQLLVGIKQLTEEDIVTMLQADAPSGSEGGLKITANRTQIIKVSSIKVSSFEAVWGSVTFVGDLRDFEDTKKVENWLKQIPEKLKKHQAMIRQAAISIDVEYGPCIGIVWNPRTDNFTVIDIPSP